MRVGRQWSSRRAVSAGSRAFIFFRSTFGGFTVSAGFRGSYREIEELFLERGLEVDHSTLNRWVLAYAPLIERRLRHFRKPHCGSIRVDETYARV